MTNRIFKHGMTLIKNGSSYSWRQTTRGNMQCVLTLTDILSMAEVRECNVRPTVTILPTGIRYWFSQNHLILRTPWSIWEEPEQLSRYSDCIRAGRPRFDSRYGKNLLHSVQTGSWAHPGTYQMGTEDSFPWVKRPRREADHSPPSSAEVKSGGAIPSLPHMSSWHCA
jgi:hypothetical protein